MVNLYGKRRHAKLTPQPQQQEIKPSRNDKTGVTSEHLGGRLAAIEHSFPAKTQRTPDMKIYFAPMEGVVDHHMRQLIRAIGGIDLCVTEFIRVTDHTLPRKVFMRYCPELVEPADAVNTPPTRIQLLGSNPEALAANARKAAQLGAPGIDLNFGCPAKTVNKNRGGACLLNEPETLYQIIKQTRVAVPEHIPVTAKIRLGYEDRNSYKENAVALYEAGASEIVVHARSKQDGYKPPAYWSCIADIKSLIPIPVIANGEIWNLADFHQCRQESGCEDVMLGRGLLANPDLALAIKADVSGLDYPIKTWLEIATSLFEFFLMTSHAYPKKYMGNRVKQWLFYLKRHYPEADRLFEKLKRSRDYQEIFDALTEGFSSDDIARIEQDYIPTS